MNQQCEAAFKLALSNISRYGDTDVLPFPFENHIFYDMPEESLDLLKYIAANTQAAYQDLEIAHEAVLTPVGYQGFRKATLIEPFWNAFMLGHVLYMANDIETARIEPTRNIAFSYRYKPNKKEGSLFNQAFGFNSFLEQSRSLSDSNAYVVSADISDFYPRIYHHRLENALRRATKKSVAIDSVLYILKNLSGRGTSYGLPVGGPAARILSELLLNSTDKLLVAERITFCRFSDDYRIFAESQADAYAKLVTLSEKLLENEGLTLQKNKTHISQSRDYLRSIENDIQTESSEPLSTDAIALLALKIYYDPYSPTATSDYERLKDQLRSFDIASLLSHELRKARIHRALTRRILASLNYLNHEQIQISCRTIVDNLDKLYPIFQNVLITLTTLLDKLEPNLQSYVKTNIRNLIDEDSYLFRLPVNCSFALRLLANDLSDECDATLTGLYSRFSSPSLRRDIILAMARRGATYLISDHLPRYGSMHPWEKRALIVASYVLGDEGKHWRQGKARTFNRFEELVQKWASQRAIQGNWQVPL